MERQIRVNNKVVNATPWVYNNINFNSKLEVSIYKFLEKEGFAPIYEPLKFTIWHGFKPRIPFYIKDKNTRSIKLDNYKIRDITYTPDIVFYYNTHMIIVEVKPDYENDVFPYKKKIFRKFLEEQFENVSEEHIPIYVQVGTIKNLKEFINILKEKYNEEFEGDFSSNN